MITILMKKITFLLLFLTGALSVFAQQVPIGNWKSYFPYTICSSVAIADDKVYNGKYGLLQYNKTNQEFTNFTKVNGLSDVNISQLAFDKVNKQLVIVYENANIDVYENNVFYNIPDIKKTVTSGSKKVNSVRIINNDAYICTSIGIIVVNINKKEIKATYPLLIMGTQSEVYDVCVLFDSIYASTSNGLFKANIQNNN
jgi:hypothetical protein